MWVPSTVTRLELVVVVPKAHSTGPLMVPAAHRHLLCLRLGLGLGLRLQLRLCRRSEFFASVPRAVLCGAQPQDRVAGHSKARSTGPPGSIGQPLTGSFSAVRPSASGSAGLLSIQPMLYLSALVTCERTMGQAQVLGSRWVIAQGTATRRNRRRKDPLCKCKTQAWWWCTLPARARDAK